MEHIDATVAGATVTDTEGKAHPLGSLWADHTAVLAFVRHFG
jgi:hypothetical protein